MTDAELARAIAEKAAEQGGTVYFVGGCVRDRLLGLENKDIDIEVHGIPAEALEQLLSELGACMKIGKSFGIYGLKEHALDIALPRIERRTGVGHRDFAVTSDPFLGTYEAAKRRDFTMNALMQNVLTGEIIDHFGGRQDLQDGVLRHVDDVTFTEDPLRVLRAAQFAARFQFSVAAETVELCRRIDLSALSRERVMLEMEKALLRAEKPSLFFGELRTMGQLGHWFPEVQALIGLPQNQIHHQEGDTWTHTMLVLDEAAKRRAESRCPAALMWAALLHDIGKPDTTRVRRGKITSYDHDKVGAELARRFLSGFSMEPAMIDRVCALVRFHMQVLFAAKGLPFGDAAGMKAHADIQEVALLGLCDRMGRLHADLEEETENIRTFLRLNT